MAEPDAIFKNGAYVNVNEGQVYIGVISLSTKLSNVISINDQYDVVFERLWDLYWRGRRESRKNPQNGLFEILVPP